MYKLVVAAIGLIVFVTTTVAQEVGRGGASEPGQATPPGAGAGAGGRGRGPRPPAFIPDAPVLPHVAVDNPLPLPEGMSYGTVASVAIDSKGHIFVFHRADVPLVEFDARGRFVRGLLQGGSTRAHSVRVDRADNLWLVDTADQTVVKVNPQGQIVMTLGTKGVVGSGDADAAKPLFNVPSDVAIAANGDIFVSQGENGGPDPRVTRFTSAGKFVNTWSLAYTQGTRSNPHAIEIAPDALVYVADREVMRLRVFRQDGTPVREIQMRNPVCGLYIDSHQQLWIATGADGQFMKLDWNGNVLGYGGRRGTGVGETNEAHMLAVAPNGDVYVADSVGRRVLKFASP